MIETSLRIGFSLLVVFGLMWGIAKAVRRPLAGRTGEMLSVLARQQLTRSSSVALVRVADQVLIVGVTDGQVTLLGQTEPAALEAAQAGQTTQRTPVHLVTDEMSEMPKVSAFDADQVSVAAAPGRFAGSALSPQTWSATIEFLRTRTARK